MKKQKLAETVVVRMCADVLDYIANQLCEMQTHKKAGSFRTIGRMVRQLACELRELAR